MYHVVLRCYEVLIIVSNGYPSAKGRLPTRYSPVRRFPLTKSTEASIARFSLDLHVLGTPPAFILSQDQTLNKLYLIKLGLVKSFSVTRMTRLRHYCVLRNCTGTNNFHCCLLYLVFKFQYLRPVLHYEVFKVLRVPP